MSLIAKMHVAKKQLGLDDDTYRAALEKVTGKTSAKDMNDHERLKVIAHFTASGFTGRTPTPKSAPSLSGKPLTGTPREKLVGKYAGKLQALWIAGWNLGLVKNKDDAALLAFVKRQTGIDHTRFLRDADDAYKAIEAMKKWLERAGVDWTVTSTMADCKKLAGYKIAHAQWELMADKSFDGSELLFSEAVKRTGGRGIVAMIVNADWHPVMNAFGERIRAQKAVQS